MTTEPPPRPRVRRLAQPRLYIQRPAPEQAPRAVVWLLWLSLGTAAVVHRLLGWIVKK